MLPPTVEAVEAAFAILKRSSEKENDIASLDLTPDPRNTRSVVDLDAAVDAWRLIIRKFDHEAEKRRAAFCKQRNAILPIHRLPAELLEDILEFSLGTRVPDDMKRIAKLKQVCSRWHDTLTNLPRIWTMIFCSDPPKVLNLKFCNSRGTPLHLVARASKPGTPSLTRAYPMLSAEAHRFEHIELLFDGGDLPIVCSLLSSSFSRLETLSLTANWHMSYGPSTPALNMPTCPRLKRVLLSRLNVSVSLLHACTALVHLRLRYVSFGDLDGRRDRLSFPKLERLELVDLSSEAYLGWIGLLYAPILTDVILTSSPLIDVGARILERMTSTTDGNTTFFSTILNNSRWPIMNIHIEHFWINIYGRPGTHIKLRNSWGPAGWLSVLSCSFERIRVVKDVSLHIRTDGTLEDAPHPTTLLDVLPTLTRLRLDTPDIEWVRRLFDSLASAPTEYLWQCPKLTAVEVSAYLAGRIQALPLFRSAITKAIVNRRHALIGNGHLPPLEVFDLADQRSRRIYIVESGSFVRISG